MTYYPFHTHERHVDSESELPPLAHPKIDKLRRQRLARVRRSHSRERGMYRVPSRHFGSGSL